MCNEVADSPRKIILFIDDIHNLVPNAAQQVRLPAAAAKATAAATATAAAAAAGAGAVSLQRLAGTGGRVSSSITDFAAAGRQGVVPVVAMSGLAAAAAAAAAGVLIGAVLVLGL